MRRYGAADAEMPDLIVIDGGKGASQAARKIVKEAYLLGVDIESSVKDEYGDNMAMRRAAGLL